MSLARIWDRRVAGWHTHVTSTSGFARVRDRLLAIAAPGPADVCVDLGAGKSCTFKPTLLDHSNLQLTMAVESKNAAGKTEGLSVVQIVTKSGKPFEVAVGDMNFTLTPKLQSEQ